MSSILVKMEFPRCDFILPNRDEWTNKLTNSMYASTHFLGPARERGSWTIIQPQWMHSKWCYGIVDEIWTLCLRRRRWELPHSLGIVYVEAGSRGISLEAELSANLNECDFHLYFHLCSLFTVFHKLPFLLVSRTNTYTVSFLALLH